MVDFKAYIYTNISYLHANTIADSSCKRPQAMTFSYLSYLYHSVMYHSITAALFTWTDFKTIILPVVRVFFFVLHKNNLTLSRLSLLVPPRHFTPWEGYCRDGCGYGCIYFSVMSPIKWKDIKKTLLTTHGGPSHPGGLLWCVYHEFIIDFIKENRSRNRVNRYAG